MIPQVAVAGFGAWGQHLVRNFSNLGALRIICDNDPERLARARAEYGGAKASTTFEDILNDDGVQAVVIATPASLHYSLAKAVLEAGKDVFVEKPLALRVQDGEELVELAEAGGRILMVGHLLQYHPAIIRLKELVAEGRLGKLYYLYSNRLNLGIFRREENILWSFAPHDVSVIVSLLNEAPVAVAAYGGSYLREHLADVTLTTLDFAAGVKAHIFVSWLHPYKEQRLVVVGDEAMAAFDDLAPTDKLFLYPHKVDWRNRHPLHHKEQGEAVPLAQEEPLRVECQHFLECVANRTKPRTDGQEGLRVLRVLAACQQSLDEGSHRITFGEAREKKYFAHESAVIDEPCKIGEGTRIWHFSHIMRDAKVGKACTIGQNVMIASGVVIGDRVKIQNNVSVYTGVTLESGVFCGPSMVFTNIINPRSLIPRRDKFQPTLVKEGATLGANCTILCGHTIGRHAFIGAGAVVTKDVPDHALVLGNPGRVVGWMCRCGVRLPEGKPLANCQSCGARYRLLKDRIKLAATDPSSEGPR